MLQNSTSKLIPKECSNNIVYGPCKDIYGLNIDCSGNTSGLVKGKRTITYNDIPGIKCPEPTNIACNLKCDVNCVGDWKDVETCKINRCNPNNNKEGLGKQIQEFNVTIQSKNKGNPCPGSTREVNCSEDDYIECTQCGGSNGNRIPGATCDNIKSCEYLLGVGERIDKWHANSNNILPDCITPPDMKVKCTTAGEWPDCKCKYVKESKSSCNETNTICKGVGSECTVNYTKREPLPQPNNAPGICPEKIDNKYDNVNLNLCTCTVTRDIGDWIYTNPRCDSSNRITFLANRRSRPITIKKTGGNKACIFNKISENESLLDTVDNNVKGKINQNKSLQFGTDNDFNGATFQTIETENYIKFENNINCICDGTYEDWTNWSNWTNDTICPSTTDYTSLDISFNITQSRTANRTFRISNSNRLLTNYSCPQQENINTQKIETQNYTCPRNCLGEWSEWAPCNTTCPINPATNSSSWIKNFTEGQIKQTATYRVKKSALGTGDVCTNENDCSNNFVYSKCKDIYGLDIDCKENTTGNITGIERGTKNITFNEISGKKCPNPLKIECTEKCPINCVGDWKNVGICKINSCNNTKGVGKQTQEFDVKILPKNGGDPCSESTREVECSEDNYIECTQCGGKNGSRVPGATCDNIKSCEGLFGVGERIDKWSANSNNVLPGCITPADMKIPCRTDGEWPDCKCRYDKESVNFCNESNTVCKGTSTECTVNYTKREPLPQPNNAPGICPEKIDDKYDNVNLNLCTCTITRNIGDWIYTNPRCDPNNRTTFIANKRSRPITIIKTGGNKACIFNKLSNNEILLDTPDNKIKGKINPNGSLQFGTDNDFNGTTFQTIETENYIKFENNINCICDGTYENWTDWSNWTNDTICPSSTDYTSLDISFNITQSRTANRTFRISNSNRLLTNYSCPQQENINTQKKETRNYTCPRNCLGEWSEWTPCNTTCPVNPATNSSSWIKNFTEGQIKQTATYRIKKSALGTGNVCTNPNDCSNNFVYSNCKDIYGLDIDCKENTTGNITGIETGTKNIIFNEISGKKCPNPLKIECTEKCPVNCVGDWINVGTCKINSCNNTKGEGKQTQEFDAKIKPVNEGDPCPGSTREVPCSEDNYIGCIQCGGKNGSRVPGATCDNIQSCEGLFGAGERIDKWSTNNYNVLPGCIMPPDMRIPCRTDGEWLDCKCRYDKESVNFCDETNTVCKGISSECSVNYTLRKALPQLNNTPSICPEKIDNTYDNVNLNLCTCTVTRDIGDWIYINSRCDSSNRRTFLAHTRSRPITIKKAGGNKACIFNKQSINETLLDTPDNKIKGKINPNGSLQFGEKNDFNGATFQTVETENYIKFENNINCICDGTYENWTVWSNWTNDTICPSATDYTSPDISFNITQSRTANRTFKISNSNRLLTNYSCPQQENINTQKKETRNYTCPRNCLGEWSEWTQCNTTCPVNPATNSSSWIKNFTEGQIKQTATYRVKKSALGTGDVCTNENDCSNNFVYSKCKDIYGLDIDCKENTTGNITGIERGTKNITFNEISGKKCPNPLKIECTEKCPVNCVGDWKNVGICKINSCNNTKGEGKQTQEFDAKIKPVNGGDPCPGSTREVPCSEDNHIGCTQCGGKNGSRVPGTTCDNIKSCEGLFGVGERIDKWSANSNNVLPGCIMPPDMNIPCRTDGEWLDCKCRYDKESVNFCDETNTVCKGISSECSVNYTLRKALPQLNNTPSICPEKIDNTYDNVNLNLCTCTVTRDIGDWIYINSRCDPSNRTTFLANKRSREITITKTGGNIACILPKQSINETLLNTDDNNVRGKINPNGSLQFGKDNDYNGAQFQTVETENYIKFENNTNCICKGAHENWTDWSNWTNDTICPSATDYTSPDISFNITQNRTSNRTFRISNSSDLFNNYSCPQQENINTQKKETRNYTCPRNCLGEWSEWAQCNTTCPVNPATNSSSWIKNFTEGRIKQTATYRIKKSALGTGNVCTNPNDCSFIYSNCKDIYGLDIDCKENTTGNITGIETGIKNVTFNEISGKKCPNPLKIACTEKCQVNCVGDWKNVGICKINSCNNTKGEGKQTQEFDAKIKPVNGGDPCLGPTKEVPCSDDNHIGCIQCGGINGGYVPGATCDNIKSCEGLFGVGERIDKWSANSNNVLPGCIMPPDMNIPCRTDGELDACKCRYDKESISSCNETNTTCKGASSECTVNYTRLEPLPQQNNAPGICPEKIDDKYDNVNLDNCTCTVTRNIGDWIYINPRCNPNNRTTFLANKRYRPITITKTVGNKACIIPKLSNNEILLDTVDNKIKGKMNPNGSFQFGAENNFNGAQFQTIEIDNYIKFENSNYCNCEATNKNPIEWTNWKNDINCPSATDYTTTDSAFNITQSRTVYPIIKISDSSSSFTNYLCPKKETQNYTCPRNCLSEITNLSKCNPTCPIDPIKVKTVDDEKNKIWELAGTSTGTNTIKKTKLGTGNICTNQNTVNCTVKCPYLYDNLYTYYNAGGICPDGYNLDNDLGYCIEKCRTGYSKGDGYYKQNYGYINDKKTCNKDSSKFKYTNHDSYGYNEYYIGTDYKKLICNNNTIKNEWRCLPDCVPGYTFDPTTTICSPTIK